MRTIARPMTAAVSILRVSIPASVGYPSSAMIAHDRALVVYYFNQAGGRRTIEGTIAQME